MKYVLPRRRVIAPLVFSLFPACFASPTLFASDTPNAHRSVHRPQEQMAAIHASKHVGREVYRAYCGVCHAKAPQISMGAPREGVASDWTVRLKRRSIKKMVKAMENPIGAMPAYGGCTDCTDQDLKLAIKYMLKGDHDER